MRVIGGKYRRLLLKAPEGMNTRPSLDQVKEAAFSIISEKVYEARCLDLFAGSGALGIEALSRGASFVHFNDLSKKAIRVVKENLEHLKVSEPYLISELEYTRLIQQQEEPYDLIFLDPPYRFLIHEEIISLMEDKGLVSPYGIFVCETTKEAPTVTHTGYVGKEYHYGNVKLTILRRQQ